MILPMVLCIAIVFLSGCTGKHIMDTSGKNADIGTASSASLESSVNSESLYSFSFTIGEDSFSLPMSYSDILQLGWSCPIDPDTQLEPGEDMEEAVLKKDGLEFDVIFTNISTVQAPARYSMLTAVHLDSSVLADSPVVLSGGVVLGQDTADSLISKAGQPNETTPLEDQGQSYWFYEYDKDELIVFTVNDSDKILVEAELFRLTVQEAAAKELDLST